jgi:hypothetical protein
MQSSRILSRCVVIPVLAFASALTYARTVDVNCGSHKGPLSSITAALAQLDPTGPNNIVVSGVCTENVLIQSFDRLILKGTAGATINDASNGAGIVVDIQDSQRVTVQGLTINGGANGIVCESFSRCTLSGNIIQNAIGAGVIVAQAVASIEKGVIQNNAEQGVISLDGGNVVITDVRLIGNGADAAADARNASLLQIISSNIEGNLNHGVQAIDNSSVVISGSRITGNGADGIHVEHASTVKLNSVIGINVVTANTGAGVFLRDLSFGFFGAGGATITGNGGAFDVSCNPQFPATRGALTNIGGGTTNCVEP